MNPCINLNARLHLGTKLVKAEPADGPEGQPGYRITYSDGYESWSPKDVFEESYRPCDALTFELALDALKMGRMVARKGWNGKGLWLEMQRPDVNSKMTLPYIYLNYPDDAQNTPGARVPWLASQTDMLAEDWVLL